MHTDTTTMLGYEIKYRDDLRFDGKVVRRIWPIVDSVLPQPFLDQVISNGYKYEIIKTTARGIECIDLIS